jgi:hypothetical protein
MEEQYSIERRIQQIYDILNHWTNLPLNGQPPYSPLPEESVRLLKEQLERLKKFLAEKKEVRKEELKLDGLKEEESYRIIPIKIGERENILFLKKYIPIFKEPKCLEPNEPNDLEDISFKNDVTISPETILEPILLEPTRFEPKLLKTRPHKKSDGWRQANKNPRGPVCRY